MHEESGTICGTFRQNSIKEYFMKNIANKDMFTKCKGEKQVKDRLKIYHRQFLNSMAGQSVATYILGVRDRHPSNFMLQETTGRFFHIDFGHFLDSCKFKCRIKRDREPFIYSDELNYFLKKFEAIKAEKTKESSEVKS